MSKQFENIPQLELASLLEGQYTLTKGAAVAGDGLGAVYLVGPNGIAGPNDVVLANGNIAIRQTTQAILNSYDNTQSGISADDVQDALDEIAAAIGASGTVVSITAGDGLSDSGTSENPILDVNAGTGILIAGDAVTFDSTYGDSLYLGLNATADDSALLGSLGAAAYAKSNTVINSSDAQLIDIVNPSLADDINLNLQSNVANGLVKLDSLNKVPVELLPFNTASLQGVWSPTVDGQVPPATGLNGQYYIFSDAGPMDLYEAGNPTPTVVNVDAGQEMVFTTNVGPTGWYYVATDTGPINATSVQFDPTGTGYTGTNSDAVFREIDTDFGRLADSQTWVGTNIWNDTTTFNALNSFTRPNGNPIALFLDSITTNDLRIQFTSGGDFRLLPAPLGAPDFTAYLGYNYGTQSWEIGGGGTIWNNNNDGTGSGLDADLLDAQQGSYYTNAGNLNAGQLPTARFNDTSHGSRSGGNLHTIATTSADGFMSGADKTKLDGISAGAGGNQNVVAGSGLTGGGTGDTTTLNVGAGNGITVSTNAIAVNLNVVAKKATVQTGTPPTGGSDGDVWYIV